MAHADSPPAKWSRSKKDSEERRHDEEWTDYKDASWSEVKKGLLSVPDVGEYQRNKKRADELIAYAAPYRLNIVTTPASLQTSGEYQLVLTNPQTRIIEQAHIVRELVDLADHPSAVLRGYIDQMKRTMEQKSPIIRDEIDAKFIYDIQEYAKPFSLLVEKDKVPGQLGTNVELVISHPDYGYNKRIVTVAAGSRSDAQSKCGQSINDMRSELGWIPEKKEEKVAQLVPFVLECPDHGGQMAKVKDEENHDEYFVCLVPGCKKKARQKNRVQPGGFGVPPDEGTSTTGSMGASDFLNLQGEHALPPDTQIQIHGLSNAAREQPGTDLWLEYQRSIAGEHSWRMKN